MLVEDDHEDMSSDEEDTNAAREGAAALLRVSRGFGGMINEININKRYFSHVC